MKILRVPLILVLLAYVLMPYVTVIRFDRALSDNDIATLEYLIDIDAVRQDLKTRMGSRVQEFVGEGTDPIVGFLTGGINRLGETAIDQMWTAEAIRESLTSIANDSGESKLLWFKHVSFAFFESYDSFIMRFGELGQDPRHAKMRLRNWDWRVVAVYD